MGFFIRRREKGDCKSIAHIVTVCWNETYKGIVPDWYLEELKANEPKRARAMEESFNINENYYFVLEVDNQVVGFVRFGKSEDKDFENCGEVIAFYVLKEYQGKGWGKRLFQEAINALKMMGFDKMIVACLKGNPTNEIYKHMGGKYIKDGVYERLSLLENIYYYDI